MEVGVHHWFLFLLIIISVVIIVALLTSAKARSALAIEVAFDKRRVENRLARLGMEDEWSQEQALDELDERVAFLIWQKRALRRIRKTLPQWSRAVGLECKTWTLT